MNIFKLSLLSIFMFNIILASDEPIFSIPTAKQDQEDKLVAKKIGIACIVFGGFCAAIRRIPGAIARHRTVLRPDILTGTHYVEYVLTKEESKLAVKYDSERIKNITMKLWQKIKPDHVSNYSPVTPEAEAAELSIIEKEENLSNKFYPKAEAAELSVMEKEENILSKFYPKKNMLLLPSVAKSSLSQKVVADIDNNVLNYSSAARKAIAEELFSKESNFKSVIKDFNSDLTKLISYFPSSSLGEHRLYESLKCVYPKYSWLTYKDFKYIINPLMSQKKISKFYVDHLDDSGLKTPCIDFSKLK